MTHYSDVRARRILKRVAGALAMLLGLGLLGIPAWVPLVEQRNVFQPRPYDPAMPWVSPPSTDELHARTIDDVDLFGWHMKATAQTAKATLLYLHGNSGALPDYVGALEQLRERGFDILAWDYRGYGRSGGSVDDEAALYRDGEAMLAASLTVADRTADQLVIYGYSLGTAVATELALRHGCRALVLQAPIATLPSHVLSHAPMLPAFPLAYLRNRFDTAGKIDKVRCPVLVIHGDQDEGILVSQGRAVFAAAHEPKRLVIVPGGRHVLDERSGWPQATATARFVDDIAP